MRTQPVYSNAGFIQPIEIRQGADFDIVLALFNGTAENPISPVGVTGKATMRNLSAGTVTHFVVTILDVDGSVHAQFHLDPSVTASLALSPTSLMAAPIYSWNADVKLADGRIVPMCYGPGKVLKGETSWP